MLEGQFRLPWQLEVLSVVSLFCVFGQGLCVCGGEEEGVEVGLLLCLVGLFVFLFPLSSSI